ncbi:hypothetical protein BVRB_7g178960 [Beta vulgaris subsp. vulgaris]|uniref:Uncharacterized protein n=1 Tax=Beta vulgaris subsp. vulgaris TaxID=3555 RepID=A0A0J8B796_BETVV|nr:hypothetical protein BVRB_7g178960 [Beta vulgaris subsp. vulgaris]
MAKRLERRRTAKNGRTINKSFAKYSKSKMARGLAESPVIFYGVMLTRASVYARLLDKWTMPRSFELKKWSKLAPAPGHTVVSNQTRTCMCVPGSVFEGRKSLDCCWEKPHGRVTFHTTVWT